MTKSGLLAACLVLLSTTADAHFELVAPPSRTTQNSLGDPQKDPPCGPAGAGTPTNEVTTVMTGSMLTITVKETVFHPGHYRIAIAQDMAGLPAPPPVTTGTTACGSVPIAQNPTLPLLADGVFVHTTSFTAPQTTQIALPAGMTCNNCVVQVLEFMSNHAAPCFYYHCATVTISDTAPPPPDAGVAPNNDAGTTPGGGEGDGCCDTRRSSPPAGWFLGLLVFVLVMRRRR